MAVGAVFALVASFCLKAVDVGGRCLWRQLSVSQSRTLV